MLVNCNSCQKKFTVPDTAITEAGRLLQCGSCGNKWTQYPIKEELIKEIVKTTPIKIKQQTEKIKIKTSVKKKKRTVNLYSEEYLKKKHGLEIKDSLDGKNIKKSKNNPSSFGFFNYLITTTIFFITLFAILNLSKDIIIMNYPFTEDYIYSFYEILEILKIAIFALIN
jgi:predicted Zn finger-like uncharacterized protein|tara:strand:+ start:24 stop:530 length:507 start_codon:yes stop_codon:yes gene_type:complete